MDERRHFDVLAVMGFTAFGFREGIHMMLGIALNWKGNLIHADWVVIGLASEAQSEVAEPEISEVLRG